MKSEKFDNMSGEEYELLKKCIRGYIRRHMKRYADLPTFERVGHRFALTHTQLEQVCEDMNDVNVNLGCQVPGVGYCTYEDKDWTLELLEKEENGRD
jgi:hypothetical protein